MSSRNQSQSSSLFPLLPGNPVPSSAPAIGPRTRTGGMCAPSHHTTQPMIPTTASSARRVSPYHPCVRFLRLPDIIPRHPGLCWLLRLTTTLRTLIIPVTTHVRPTILSRAQTGILVTRTCITVAGRTHRHNTTIDHLHPPANDTRDTIGFCLRQF